MNISKRIASIREAKGFTQKQIADLLDMEQSNYSRLEGRDNKLTIEQLEKIAGALGVSVIELLTGEGQKVGDSEEVERLKDRVKELEQSLKEVRELNVYQQKTIESKNVALKLVYETIDLYYVILQQSVLEEPEMPIELAKTGYSYLNDLLKIAKLIVEAGDLGTMEESLRKMVRDENDIITALSIFDRRSRKGGLAYWDGKYVVSEKNKPDSE